MLKVRRANAAIFGEKKSGQEGRLCRGPDTSLLTFPTVLRPLRGHVFAANGILNQISQENARTGTQLINDACRCLLSVPTTRA